MAEKKKRYVYPMIFVRFKTEEEKEGILKKVGKYNASRIGAKLFRAYMRGDIKL